MLKPLLAVLLLLALATSFRSAPSPRPGTSTGATSPTVSATISAIKAASVAEKNEVVVHAQARTKTVTELKLRLFALSAACDRGFAASPRERERILGLASDLASLSPTAVPTRNFGASALDAEQNTPLSGSWRMVFTRYSNAQSPASV